jgi:hypothetical protein
MIRSLKIKDIWNDISGGKSSKKKGETGETSMLIRILSSF